MAIIDRRGATVSATDAPASSTPNPDLAIKTAVRVASTGSNVNIQTFGLGVLDGITLAAGDRVLLKDQSDKTQNGIYNVSTGVWAMAVDFQTNSQVANGLLVFVNFGTLNAQTLWALNATDPIVLGTTQLTFLNRVPNLSSTAYPVINPSSGNFQGPGNLPVAAYLRSDENFQLNADVIQFFSNDPSAGIILTLGGSVTVGDVVTLRFIYASQNIPVSYTVQAGDSYANGRVISGLIAAIAANPILFNLNGATVSSGVITPAPGATASFGGYANGAQIGYVVITSATSLAFDYNAKIPMSMSYSVTGAATETVLFPAGFLGTGTVAGGSTASVVYALPNSLDNNPAIVTGRFVDGVPPPNASVIFSLYATSSQSSTPHARTVGYGNISHWVGNSTTAALKSAWLFSSTNTAGALAGGVWIGQGLYSNDGGAPFSAGATADMGLGTANMSKAYWLNGVHKIGFSGSIMTVTPATGFALVMSVDTGGVGVNATPTGVTFTSGLGTFISGAQEPTAGAGLSLIYAGGTTCQLKAYDYTGVAYKNISLAAAITQFAPSGVTTDGAQIQQNAFAPAVDNQFFMGGPALRFATTYSVAFVGTTVTAPTIAGGTAAGSTLTLESTSGAGTTDAIIFKTASQAEALRILTGGNIKYTNAANFAANNARTVTVSNVGPATIGATIAKWLTFQDSGGVASYVPVWQ